MLRPGCSRKELVGVFESGLPFSLKNRMQNTAIHFKIFSFQTSTGATFLMILKKLQVPETLYQQIVQQINCFVAYVSEDSASFVSLICFFEDGGCRSLNVTELIIISIFKFEYQKHILTCMRTYGELFQVRQSYICKGPSFFLQY